MDKFWPPMQMVIVEVLRIKKWENQLNDLIEQNNKAKRLIDDLMDELEYLSDELAKIKYGMGKI